MNPLVDENGTARLVLIDDIAPENVATLQALYSRSSASVLTHLDTARRTGVSRFMDNYVVGYNHKSIADCGSTTIFFEGVSLLAAKAFEDWPLYSGQETSTRYIDMTQQALVDPVGTPASKAIHARWMEFYTQAQPSVDKTIRDRFPMCDGENPKVYDRAVKARVFDSLRAFLPAGVTTQFSWHTNLRQAGDHLRNLMHHPLAEVRTLAARARDLLAQRYPHSGFTQNLAGVSGVTAGQATRDQWERLVWEGYGAYQEHRCDAALMPAGEFSHTISMRELASYTSILKTRPRGCVLPHFLSDLGQCYFGFLLDFGSYRDIQRQRNGVCRMPMLTTDFGFEPWYFNQLNLDLAARADLLIETQVARIDELIASDADRQYYVPLGFRVPTSLMYSLPAAVYVMELRSSKTVHATLRHQVIHRMVNRFQPEFPTVTLHVDLDPSDWDVRRGTQTITAKS